MRCVAGFHSPLLPRLIGHSAVQYEENTTPPASVLVTGIFLKEQIQRRFSAYRLVFEPQIDNATGEALGTILYQIRTVHMRKLRDVSIASLFGSLGLPTTRTQR